MAALATLLVILAYSYNVYALDMEGAKEKCFKVESVPMDLDWFVSQPVWYYPLMNKNSIYHMSADFLSEKHPKYIREDVVYYNSCITTWVEGTSQVVRGFEKVISYKVSPLQGFEQFSWEPESKGVFMKGTSYVTLTDNNTFLMQSTCLSDGNMTWGIISTLKKLSEETRKIIYDYAESIGFNRQLFTGFQYDSCKVDLEDKFINKKLTIKVEDYIQMSTRISSSSI